MEGRQDAKVQLAATENGFDGFMVLSDWTENVHDIKSSFESFGEYFRSKLNEALSLADII